MTTKARIHDHLYQQTGMWFTVAQLLSLIPSSDPTISRALRKLRAEGRVVGQFVPGKRHKQWCCCPSQAPVSGGKKKTMSTLQTVIESVINEFVAAQKTFSAFEVTQELRNRSNAGTVTIDKTETGSVYVNGNDVPRIEHDKVRAEVHDLFTQGKMAGYDRSNNGQYWQYGPATIPDPSSATPVLGSDNGTPSTDGSSYDGSSTL